MIIVMTGATAGIGAEALNHFAKLHNTKVYVGARGNGRIVPEGTEVLSLDLSSLKSVRSFADNIKQRLGNDKIDILVLNAGIQATDNKLRSEDGFGLTFATNHLAHYLLARLFVPNMAKGGRVVITTSDAHDPAVIPFGPKTLNIYEQAFANLHDLISEGYMLDEIKEDNNFQDLHALNEWKDFIAHIDSITANYNNELQKELNIIQ